MTAFIKSVEYVEITLPSNTAVSVDLTKSQTIANCVPFFTTNMDVSTNDRVNVRYPEVFFTAGSPNKVTAQRAAATGTIIVGVFVVEFDTTGDVSVEQGTWSMADTETNDAVTLGATVTTTKAFCVISYRNADGSDDFDNGQVAVSFTDGDNLSFDRAGGAGAVTGRYYVVKTSGTDFSVQHVSMAVASAEDTDSVLISSVTENKTFVYSTYQSATISDDLLQGAFVVDLEDSTHVRARRGFDSFGGSPGVPSSTATIEAQIVSAGGTEFSVERSECDFTGLTKAVTITEIDQARAIVIGGGYNGIMSLNSAAGGDIEGAHCNFPFTSNTVVTGTRGVDTANDGTTFFEAVQFVLAAVGDPAADTPVWASGQQQPRFDPPEVVGY